MLAGKTALVTGGVGDLGSEMALQLAQAGAGIALWDVRPSSEVTKRIERLQQGGTHLLYQQVDVRRRAEVDSAMQALIAEFGGIDIACVNAGIVEGMPFLDITEESWQRQLDVNLTGAFNVAQAVARQMVAAQTQGRIIFTSTWVAQVPWPEITAYTVSKAGLNMLMKQMARELAIYGIRVNAVAPGIVKAGLAGRQMHEDVQYAARVAKVIPLGEPGTPVEIGQAVLYLASPQASYITGSVLTIDGGCSLFQFDSE